MTTEAAPSPGTPDGEGRALNGFNWDAANIEQIARHKVTPAEAEQGIENDPFDAATRKERAFYSKQKAGTP